MFQSRKDLEHKVYSEIIWNIGHLHYPISGQLPIAVDRLINYVFQKILVGWVERIISLYLGVHHIMGINDM